MSACPHAEVSDNKYPSCPARMSDGRLFTNYNSRCAVQAAVLPPNMQVMSSAGLDSYDLRQYMIRNADSIMQAQRESALCAARCSPCVDTMLPELEIDSCDILKCVRKPGVADGLGLGRDHGHAKSSHGETPGASTLYAAGRPLASHRDGTVVDTPWT